MSYIGRRKQLSFDDVLIVPKFSMIRSRKDVDISTITSLIKVDFKLNLPIISANMDTITGVNMTQAMSASGAMGALHRFCTIEENISMYEQSPRDTIMSIGIGDSEYERAEALIAAGVRNVLIDVAHGASIGVVEQFKRLAKNTNINIIVGNFASGDTIRDFNIHAGRSAAYYKVGIGSGGLCTTRVVTGCGQPLFSSIQDATFRGYDIIADGGIRNSGDMSKALAAGAKMVMVGSLLSGTDETPGELFWNFNGTWVDKDAVYPKKMDSTGKLIIWEDYTIDPDLNPPFKKYRGSASKESYQVQGKEADHRTAEGESTLVPYKGPVANVLQQLEAGLRSSMSYVGASTLDEFREKAEFIEITNAGYVEGTPHAKR